MASLPTSPARTDYLTGLGLDTDAEALLAADALDDQRVALVAEAVVIEATIPALKDTYNAAVEALRVKHGQVSRAHYYAYNTGNGYDASQAALEQGYLSEIPALQAAVTAANVAIGAAVGAAAQKRNEADVKQTVAAILRGAPVV